MAITNGYCTVAQLQIAIGQPVNASDPHFSFYESCIERASRFIDSETGRIYYSKTLTAEKVDVYAISESGIVIDSDRIRMLFPAPVISITEILSGTTELIEDEDFYVYNAAGIIESTSFWTDDRKGISITGTIGYASTPKNVEGWCIAIAGALSGKDASMVTDEDGGSFEYVRRTIPKWVRDDLRANRRIIL